MELLCRIAAGKFAGRQVRVRSEIAAPTDTTITLSL